VSEYRSSEFGTALSGLILAIMLIVGIYALTAGRFAAMNVVASTPEEVAARVQPVGKVTLAGETPPVSAAAPAVAQAQDPGAATYQKVCNACHGTGAAGAPKLGDKAAWASRAERGIDALLETAIQGKGAMPPRGTCATCSDEDLRAVIQYMLAEMGLDQAEAAAPAQSPAEPPATEAAPMPSPTEQPAAEAPAAEAEPVQEPQNTPAPSPEAAPQ